jgi:hypothetical protein
MKIKKTDKASVNLEIVQRDDSNSPSVQSVGNINVTQVYLKPSQQVIVKVPEDCTLEELVGEIYRRLLGRGENIVKVLEKFLVLVALDHAQNCQSLAAKTLGISSRKINYMIRKQHNLPVPKNGVKE